VYAAAYNAGPGAVAGAGGRVPHNGQTEIYVERVMQALAAERHARCRPPRRTPASSRARAARDDARP